MMEKRLLIAALLSFAFLTFYSRLIARWSDVEKPETMSRPQVQTEQAVATTRNQPAEPRMLEPLEPEEVVLLYSEDIELEIGIPSGSIHSVVLNEFQETGDSESLKFGDKIPILMVGVEGTDLEYSVVNKSQSKLVLESTPGGVDFYRLVYAIDPDLPVVYVTVESPSRSQPEAVFITTGWTKADDLSSRQNRLEAFLWAREEAGEKGKHFRYGEPFRKEKTVPRRTSWISLTERYFCQSLDAGEGAVVRLLPSPEGTIAVESRLSGVDSMDSGALVSAKVYFGPRDHFYLERSGFSGAFPIGMLGQMGLMLLVVLSAISKITHGYGIGIIVFSLLVTGAMAPFTLMSFRSMKKMQQLKPQIDRIMAQQKTDPQKANKAVFALYKENKVSPLSGCLPMMLQMPIFIALFQGLLHYVELRGESFLWIKDLSLPDRIAQLPFSIPLVGQDVNLLPIIMAVAMFVQTKTSQANMGSSQANPTAKMFSGPMMPILFGVMFYQFPSGLVLYWLTNSIMSMVWYRLAK